MAPDGRRRPRVWRRRREQGFLPGTAALRAALALLEETATGPAAFYKDSNPATS